MILLINLFNKKDEPEKIDIFLQLKNQKKSLNNLLIFN
jgi:hypothetical protein